MTRGGVYGVDKNAIHTEVLAFGCNYNGPFCVPHVGKRIVKHLCLIFYVTFIKRVKIYLVSPNIPKDSVY